MLDRYLRGVTGHVAHPIRSIQLFSFSAFQFFNSVKERGSHGAFTLSTSFSAFQLFSVSAFSAILLVGDLFHPVDGLAVQRLYTNLQEMQWKWNAPKDADVSRASVKLARLVRCFCYLAQNP